MCLYDKKKFRFIFKRIPIFKVVREPFEDGAYYSPFRHTKLSRVNRIGLESRCSPHKILDGYEFKNGFYHACLTKGKAHILALSFVGDPVSIKIVEGYIPAFTRYAIDIDNMSICARRMILNI